MNLLLGISDKEELHTIHHNLMSHHREGSIASKYLELSLQNNNLAMMRSYARLYNEGLTIVDIFHTVSLLTSLGIPNAYQVVSSEHCAAVANLKNNLIGKDENLNTVGYYSMMRVALDNPDDTEIITHIYFDRGVHESESIAEVLVGFKKTKSLGSGFL